ncbi:dihydroorotase [Tamilnaduibacter salinus]|uniref:Dihydroorotase n=1 Tax=Tamilnaduibacter salinus TaxID=1484056 RepID=A0A2U1CZ23_9GAMM|nr:dihydroorotase [Tamilnaduibacter salinus]PVY77630.1 dihydroorotase [Tamilnaduibacter salinus]
MSLTWARNPERVRIEGATLVDPASGQQTDRSVLIDRGRVAALGAPADESPVDRVVSGHGCLLTPGLTDLYASLREPGDGQKGSMASEARAAARGGFTTVCTAPDSSPVNDSGAITSLIRDLAARHSPIQVLPLGAATRELAGERLSDMVGLTGSGCVALSNGGEPLANARVLRRCMAYARTFGITLMLQPENATLAAGGFAHDGRITARLGLVGVPEVAETAAVAEMVLLAEETGVRLHLSQLSTARGVAMLREARDRGLAVTGDVAIHHLCFTEEALGGFDSRFHLRPPLRSERDRQALLAGVNDGTLSAIVSQHQPHDDAAKRAPLAETAPGLSTIESVLSLGLERVAAGELEQSALIRALTVGPAAVLDLPEPALVEGAHADLCLFDPAAEWHPSADTLMSTGKNAPVMDRSLPGVVHQTWCGGHPVHSTGDNAGNGSGLT